MFYIKSFSLDVGNQKGQLKTVICQKALSWVARPLHPSSKAVSVCASSSYLPGHAVLFILQLILKNFSKVPRHTPPYVTLAGSDVALDVQRWIKLYCK